MTHQDPTHATESPAARARVKVYTQKDLDRVLAEGNLPICVGDGRFEAWESAHVVARGSAHIVAGTLVSIHQHSDDASIDGGVVIRVQRPETLIDWCNFYGVNIIHGIATLYKGVRADYHSAHGFRYEPGSQPEAPDWDDGNAECGGGFHFSPHPVMALEFDFEATPFLACPVALADCRSPQQSDIYPQKIKARRICGPIIEVDRYGKPLEESHS